MREPLSQLGGRVPLRRCGDAGSGSILHRPPVESGNVRRLLTALGVLSLVLLSACGGRSTPSGTRDSDPQRGGELTVLVPRADAAPDPHAVRSLADAMIHTAVFRKLYVVPPAREGEPQTPDEPSEDDGPVPDLADGPARVSEDGRVVTVRIRDGVRFGGDGARQVNARDVARGIEQAVADPVGGSTARRMLAAVVGVPAPGDRPKTTISGIEATAPDTLQLRLRRPEARLVVAALSTPLSTPVPAERENVVPWTGPYVPTQDGPDGAVVLERNPDFRPLHDDWRKAYAERIRLQVDDSPGAASRVVSGDALVLGSTTVPASVAARAQKRGQLTRVVMPSTEYVGLNPTMPPFDVLDVRKAAIAAIDRQELLSAVREQGGLLASHWLPPGTPGHDEAGGAEGPRYDWLARPDGDLAVAAAYLRRAGFSDGRYRGRPIATFTAGDHRSLVVAEAVKRRLAQIGMQLDLRVVDAATARDACSEPGSGAAVCPEQVLASPVRDPEALLRPGFVEAPAWAQAGTADLAAVMTLASDTRPGEQRARAWGDIGRDVVALAPGAPWRWDERLLVVSRDVRGVVDGGAGGWDLAATSLAPEPQNDDG
jgi:peptide/nickel transport system substrate-binding protein